MKNQTTTKTEQLLELIKQATKVLVYVTTQSHYQVHPYVTMRDSQFSYVSIAKQEVRCMIGRGYFDHFLKTSIGTIEDHTDFSDDIGLLFIG